MVREANVIGKLVEINPPFWTYNFILGCSSCRRNPVISPRYYSHYLNALNLMDTHISATHA